MVGQHAGIEHTHSGNLLPVAGQQVVPGRAAEHGCRRARHRGCRIPASLSGGRPTVSALIPQGG